MITAGVDLGSTYVKCVVMKDWKRAGYAVLPTGYDHDLTSQEVLGKALEMGGLKRDHIKDIVARGARRIAVVTALTQARDIAAETRLWINAIEGEIAR